MFNLNLSFRILFLISFFIFEGCTIEDKKPSFTDNNSSVGGIEFSEKSDIGVEIPSGTEHELLLAHDIEIKLQKYFNDLVLEIKRSYPEPVSIDYQRLENSFIKLFLDNKSKESLKKYQFICDENERWIYRCNMESGEIECFSMSSNKLRLLSSIK
ncbi:MAG: hypothetical protein HN553_02275 [Opitutae bacterium]|nr:hypothetical protein [Opitutae bacterium]